VELKCLLLVEKRIPLIGRPAFPFIGHGKDPGYKNERERREEREKRWSRQPWSCTALPPWVGHVCPVDDNGGTRMLWLCSSSVLQASVAILVMTPPSFASATGRRRRLTVPPGPFLSHDMANRSPCLESHEDRVAQCQSAWHCC
jgi:hypothetical protein